MKKSCLFFSSFCMMFLLLPVFFTNALASSSDSLDISTGNVVLSKAGNYTITGSTDKYSLQITGSGTYNVTLKGVNFNLEKKIPIQIDDISAVVDLILADNTENTIESTSGDCAIFCNGSLTISGSGNLTSKEGIFSAVGLSISASGNITTNRAIANGGDLKVNGNGNLTICGSEDSVIASRLGNVEISGGNINISGKNAIVCSFGKIKISGGQLNISYNGNGNAIGLSSGSIAISENSNVNINVISSSGFAIGISGTLLMSGGSLKINASNAGIDTETFNHYDMNPHTTSISDVRLSAGACDFTGGTTTITVNASSSYGILSGALTVSGEAALIINASGKSAVGVCTYYDRFVMGFIGFPGNAPSYPGGTSSISGGTVNISSTALGIKSYYEISISGGSVSVNVIADNSVSKACGIISYFGNISVTGGTVISTASDPSGSSSVTATGISSKLATDITGGTVTASGTSCALDCTNDSFNIHSNMVISTGSKAEDASVKPAYAGEPYVFITSDAAWKNPYTDVLDTDWFYKSVAFTGVRGLLSGTGGSTFSPYQDVSRAMIATIIWRLANKPEPASSVKLTDVTSDSYYTKAAAWAVENQIMADYGSVTFKPGGYPSREQLILILYRYAKYKSYDTTSASSLSGFADADKVSSDALDAMKWAVYKGIISGSNNSTLEPDSILNRAQFAAILQRFLSM